MDFLIKLRASSRFKLKFEFRINFDEKFEAIAS